MSELGKAKRADIPIGSLSVDGFMLSDGSYRMSQSQVSECIGDDAVYARNFLKSKALKALRGEGYTPETFEIDSSDQTRGQTRFQEWPLDIAYAYWVYRCSKGNKKAFSLVIALGTETLERRFDAAFGVERTEDERNQILSDRVHQLEQDLEALGDSYAIEDEIRRERDRFEELLRENGIDPYGLPSGE